MSIILNFMDKIYGDSKTLSIIYVVGAVLLFIFIILLIISLRKSDKNEKTKIIEEPKNDIEKTNDNNFTVETKELNDEVEESNKTIEEPKKPIEDDDKENSLDNISSQNIFEKTTIIPISKENEEDKVIEKYSKEENIEKALDNAENMDVPKEEKDNIDISKLSSEIPSVDDFVDDVVKKTYEKNEQFSSVYVDNTDTVKLDKVMEDLNVDESVKENLAPTETKEAQLSEIKDNKEENIKENVEVELPKENIEDKTNTLDNLKASLEEKQEERQEVKPSNLDELKNKLNNLSGKTNPTGAVNKEELLNKLNSLKEQNK